jgi:RHS repeat-associated protein
LGRLAKTVAPNDGATKVSYTIDGFPEKVTSPTGAVAQTTYDFLGRKVTTTEAVRQTAAAYTTNYAYDTAGRLQTVTSPSGVTQSYTYNAAGETMASVDGAGKTSTTTYDGLGRPTKVTQPGGAYQTSTYDMLSRVTGTAAYASGGGTALTTSATGYDRAGNVLTSTDGRGTSTSFTYDPTGLVLTEKQPTAAGATINTSFGYDLAGNRTRYTDGRGNGFWTTYNSWGLPESTIEPATAAYPNAADRTFTTTYDAAGQAVAVASPGGVSQTYTYDSMGELTAQAGTGAAASTRTRSFGYDLGGRMTSFSAPGGTNTVSYDDRGLPVTIAGPSGNSSFSYTADGSTASRTDAAGTTAYTYDGAGRLATLKNPAAGSDLTYDYDNDSAVSKITYGGTGNARSFSYDGLKRVTADELKTAGGTSIAKIGYGWDANSNETSKTTTNFNGTTTTNTYGYDLADRLTSWNNGTATVGYTYDEAGNRTGNGSTTYTYDQRNRLVSDSAGVGYGYTARGTLSTVNGSSATYTTTSDAFDQAVSQTAAGGTSTYDYDALGRALRTGFAYTGTGNDLAADQNSTYVRDPDNDVVGAASGGSTRLMWTDLHDDVVGQFTATGTALTGSTTLDPLGLVKSTSGMLGNLGYQSEWTDGPTGRVNMAARWYNPGTGQFDSRDTASNSPVPDAVNANQYAYANVNPLTGTDPSGHGFLSRLKNKVTSTISSASSYVSSYASSAYSYASSYVSTAYHATSAYVSHKVAQVRSNTAKLVKKVKHVAKVVRHPRKFIAKVARASKNYVVKKAKAAYRSGKAVLKQTVRTVKATAKVVKDAGKATVKFVKEHKKQIIQIAAVVATVVAAVALGPVGGILVGIAINVAKDAALGDIHSLGDLGKSVAMGAVVSSVGVLTGGAGGVIGSRIATMTASKLGAGILSKTVTGALQGGISNGVSDVADQLLTTGRVNPKQVAQQVALGALVGAVTGGRTKCHSFDPETRVVTSAEGDSKPIGEVKLGDKVLSTDPKTGTTETKPVSVLHHNLDADLADVTVKDAKTGKTDVLHTTWHHPFWNAGKQQ